MTTASKVSDVIALLLLLLILMTSTTTFDDVIGLRTPTENRHARSTLERLSAQ